MVNSKNKKIMSKFILSIALIGVALVVTGNVALAADPSLSGVQGWFTTEVQIAIGIVALVASVILGIKQKIGAVIGVVLFSAFVFFMANDPTKIFNAIGGLFSKIFGG